jgi:hypothetical protein
LGGKLKQKVSRTLRITVTPTEDVRVGVSAKILIRGSRNISLAKFKTRNLLKGATAPLTIVAPKRALAAIKAALRAKKAVVAEFTVIARDAAGNAVTVRRKIKIIRAS